MSWSNLKALAAAAALLGLGSWFVVDRFVLPWLDRGNRTLYAAIESGDVGRVQAVLDAGADPNSRDAGHSASDEEWREYFPDRPLLAALRKKDFAVAKLLIQRGAQVNPDRSSPLLESAIESQDLDTIRFVLDHGAKVTQDLRYKASLTGRFDVMLAIQRAADARQRGEPGVTPLSQGVEDRKLDLVRFLLQNGADPNALTPERDPVLSAAIRTGQDAVVELLLRFGADPNVKGVVDDPLLAAVNANKTDTVRLLLDRKADPTRRYGNGTTALMAAARAGNLPVARLLIQRGADVNAAGDGGWTALSLASTEEMVELLRRSGGK